MRKTAIAVLAGAALVLAAAPSFATVLLSEGFSYANGNLVPNGGWANFSGAATDVQVIAGRAVGSGPNANDDHRFFTAQTLTNTTYACFEMMIPAVAAAPKPIYCVALKDAGTANFVARVYVLPISGGWTFGISHGSTSATVGVTPWSATTLNYDQSYRIVIAYDPVAKTSTLWVNPSNQASPSVTNTNAAATSIAISTIALRQSATAATLPASPAYVGTADWGFSVDNMGVGTTFDDACFQLTPSKASTWGRVKQLYR